MTPEAFDFFQEHSRNYLEMALRTDKQEVMHDPDGYGKRIGVCGDTVEFFLKIKKGQIQNVSYHVDGCMNTNACCNAVVHMIEQSSVETAWEITPKKVIDYLETLPTGHAHCAELSVGALYLALSNFQELKGKLWKNLYQSNSKMV